MSNIRRHSYPFIPSEYNRYTDRQLYEVLCVNCGERFGAHMWASCPIGYATHFKAPPLTTPKGNKRLTNTVS